MPILACFEIFFENVFEFFFEIFRIREISRGYHPPHTMQTMDTPPSTPPHRPKGGELSLGRRIAIVVEAAQAIPTKVDIFPPDTNRHFFCPQVSWF